MMNGKLGPSGSGQKPSQVTATESIDGIVYRVILEQDQRGIYREIMMEPHISSCGPQDKDDAELFYG